MSSIAHFFLRIEVFSAKLMLTTLYIVNEYLVFDKRKVYWPSFVIGLSAKLYGSVISKLPSYWVASNKLLDCKIRTVSLGIRYEAETHVCFLINSVISVYNSTKGISLIVVFSPGFHYPSNCIFFLSGLSFTTIHKSQDWMEREGHFFNSWLPLPRRHKHLNISRAISTDSSPLHIASCRTWNGILWFSSTSR